MEDKTAVLAAAQELAQAEDAIHGRRPREYFNSMLSHLDHQLSHRQNSFDKIQGEISRLSKAVALLATSVGRPENPSSSACLEQVGSCTSSLPAASCESTYWQPDYQRSSTSDSHAMPVFDGMPRPSYGMDSGIARELQGNKANSQANCQLLDTSSRSQYETSAMTWTYCPTLPGRVLSVNMHQVYHPVPIDVLSHLFSLYGVVETIFQSLNQHGRKVLIQYKHGYMADDALRATHGWYLYHTYCQLDIRHADSAELQILDDYSCALFSEINDADRLSHDVADIPQDEENYSSQNITPHMEGHASEQQVQTNIPVSKVVTKCTHEQKQCDGKHDASTMPNERVIEQPTSIQALEELLSIHDPKMAVQLCISDVVQAATRERQGNLASSTLLVLHVDDLKRPTSVQDASDLFEEMAVYDIYEEDTNAALNFLAELCDTAGQHKPYDSEKPIYPRPEPHDAAELSSGESDKELLPVFFSNTSDNAFSKEATDYTFPHGPVIHAERAIKLTNENRTQAVSVLCVQEATVHCDDERFEINIKKQDVLINKHGITYPCVLNIDKEVPIALQYQLPLGSAPCIWDPGIDWSYEKLYPFQWIPHSDIITLQQLCNNNISSKCELSLEKGRQVQWDPGIKLLLYDLLWLKTLSKETEYAMRHLLAVKFCTHNSTYFANMATSICCSPANSIQQRRNVAAVLHSWRSIFNDMLYCKIFQNYNAMNYQFHWYQDIKFNGVALWLITYNPP